MIQRRFSRNTLQPHRENPACPDSGFPPSPIPCPQREGSRPPRLLFLIGIALAIALFQAQTSPADEILLRGPRKAVRATMDAVQPAGTQGVLEDIAAAPVLFYQHFLSRHWGQRCGYFPSCSNYALLAIRKHGAVIGTVLTFDRLQHEADEVRTSPPILTGGQMKIYDPLENNDYWWYMEPGPEPTAPAGTRK